MVKILDDLKYVETHEWVKVDGDIATIGITDFAQNELADIVYVELPSQGTKLEKGQTFGNVEAVKAVEDLYSPLSGEVVEVNEKLQQSPELVNQDPYGEGWMIKIKITNPAEVDGLLDAEAYKKIIGI